MLKGMVFIAGFEKCGTSTLHHWLSQHPNICASIPKEPQYFEREYWLGERYYLRTYFDHRDEYNTTMLLDSRPRNAIVPYVVDRIKESCVDPKFIFLLRNPAHRAVSAWWHWRSMRPGREPLVFKDAILSNMDEFYHNEQRPFELFSSEQEYLTNLDPAGGTYKRLYLENGLYDRHIKRFEQTFGTENIHIILLEDLSYPSTYSGVLDFLQLSFVISESFRNKNEAKMKCPIELNDPLLIKFYKREIDWDYLNSMVGIDLKRKWVGDAHTT